MLIIHSIFCSSCTGSWGDWRLLFFCWLNLESSRPISYALPCFTALWSVKLCCAEPYHAEVNVIFHVALRHTFAVPCCPMPFSPRKLSAAALPQCSAPHAPVIITIKFFNEQFGAKPQPFESPESCLTATLTQWTIYMRREYSQRQSVEKVVWKHFSELRPTVSSYLLKVCNKSNNYCFYPSSSSVQWFNRKQVAAGANIVIILMLFDCLFYIFAFSAAR